MKQAVTAFIFFYFVFASCKFNPTQMGDDYCSCLQRFEQGKGTAEECREMAESHYLKLQDDEEALNKYTNYITECLMYDDIRTGKDLREDRKERRSRK